MHAILGANGVIGRQLSQVLHAQGTPVRQVSRTPTREHPSDDLASADLNDAAATERAVAGCDVAYLVAGLKYDTSVWREQWPRIMQNVIAACSRHHCRLIFLDNVYAYGRVRGAMTEDSLLQPNSRKGEVRAAIARMLLASMQSGQLEAMIVRSADFYGPHADQSMTHATVFERLRTGKTPQWLGNPDAVHTFTFTPDVGRALATLARAPDAYGGTWHAPTSAERITGKEFVQLACELAGKPYRLQRAPRWMLALMGLVMPVIRENREMMYQFDYDYYFDSSRTCQRFGLQPTPYREGVRATIESWRD